MAMTPQEAHDAFIESITFGRSAKFDELCEQLRSGELVMKSVPDGYIIRAATEQERRDRQVERGLSGE